MMWQLVTTTLLFSAQRSMGTPAPPTPTPPTPTPPTPAPTSHDCVGMWQKGWKPCSVTCGHGTKVRSYKVITPAQGDGTPCDTAAFHTTCYAGPCHTDTPTMEPTAEPTDAPTPAPPSVCNSTNAKSTRQCLRRCDNATSCPFTCRFCSEGCACTAIAMAARAEAREEIRTMKKAHRTEGVPTPEPTLAPPCAVSEDCERTAFCINGECLNTRLSKVCDMIDGGFTTTEGWTLEDIADDPNFKCEVAKDGDHKASRPKNLKHLKPEHFGWNGLDWTHHWQDMSKANAHTYGETWPAPHAQTNHGHGHATPKSSLDWPWDGNRRLQFV